MRVQDRPSVLRRGAAPPSGRACLWFLTFGCGLHLVLLSFLWIKVAPGKEYAIAGTTGPVARARLIRITPLRSFPSAEAPAEEAPKARPKPALMKRYQPGAKVVIKQERVSPKKGAKEESKSTAREVTPAPAADLVPRWYSADSSRATSVRTEGDFRFAYYLAALRNKIGSRWVPPQGIDSGRPVRTVVYFRIGRDGQVSLTQIESSSGYAFFDQTALRALLSATPLPPLPAGYADQYLGVHFGFEFAQ
ncbi:MAG: TonB family protein [Candidatus Eisenbacteria bacterium]|uniref:TonB family protein n=1 Tax=Eiseniibacteriota bacterium TaxID=2212470 RepID=A0A538SYC4_UNCEI|nr:MAG: TonB family protein [Candidatus Eisenbacteria bacterium]